jgi:peptide/nickel transport system permease protein
MTKYIIRRLLITIPIFFGVTIMVFALINIAPGDPLVALMNPDVETGLNAEQLRHQLGLDRPMPYRYYVWVSQMLHGNLGYSYVTSQPVARMIFDRLPLTLELTGCALILGVSVGVALGIVSALRQNTAIDYAVGTLGLVWIAVPGFVFAMLFLYVFAVKLNLLPALGVASLGQPFSLPDHLKHLLMPVTALALTELAGFLRYTRSSMVEVLRSDYLMVARAKGLRERVVIMRHALRNALIPVVTIIGFSVPGLFGGSVLIEQIFSWPGLGQMYLKSITQRDYPLVMGMVLISAALVLISNLLVDILYTFLDPRISYD